MGTLAGCAGTTVALFVYNLGANRRRRGDVAGEEAYLEPEVWADMADKKNRQYRYTY
jgi:hypothetical protein